MARGTNRRESLGPLSSSPAPAWAGRFGSGRARAATGNHHNPGHRQAPEASAGSKRRKQDVCKTVLAKTGRGLGLSRRRIGEPGGLAGCLPVVTGQHRQLVDGQAELRERPVKVSGRQARVTGAGVGIR